MYMINNLLSKAVYISFILMLGSILPNPLFAQDAQPIQIESWITTADRSLLFTKQKEPISFENNSGRGLPIIIDDRQQFQTIDGYGFALTWGSTLHLYNMSPAARKKLLNELFAADGDNAGISYLRLSLGASDLNKIGRAH